MKDFFLFALVIVTPLVTPGILSYVILRKILKTARKKPPGKRKYLVAYGWTQFVVTVVYTGLALANFRMSKSGGAAAIALVDVVGGFIFGQIVACIVEGLIYLFRKKPAPVLEAEK